MMCPICGAHTVVKETRDSRRRRECFNMHRFTTQEAVVVVDTAPVARGRPVRSAMDSRDLQPS